MPKLKLKLEEAKRNHTRYIKALEDAEVRRAMGHDLGDEFIYGHIVGQELRDRIITELLKRLISAKAYIAPSDVNEVDLYITAAALNILEEIELDDNKKKN